MIPSLPSLTDLQTQTTVNVTETNIEFYTEEIRRRDGEFLQRLYQSEWTEEERGRYWREHMIEMRELRRQQEVLLQLEHTVSISDNISIFIVPSHILMILCSIV